MEILALILLATIALAFGGKMAIIAGIMVAAILEILLFVMLVKIFSNKNKEV